MIGKLTSSKDIHRKSFVFHEWFLCATSGSWNTHKSSISYVNTVFKYIFAEVIWKALATIYIYFSLPRTGY